MAKRRRVIVFGIFDGVHGGHRALFAQAREHGDELVVIVGRDEICRKLKNKTPRFREEERRKLVEAEALVDRAVLGDTELSSYAVLEDLAPDAVCLGYDQQELGEDFASWAKANNKDIKLVFAKAHKPEIYQSSLIQRG